MVQAPHEAAGLNILTYDEDLPCRRSRYRALLILFVIDNVYILKQTLVVVN